MSRHFQKTGDYSLVRRVAIGGTAEVFYALSNRGEERAIKLILPHIADSREFVEMFIDEAALARRLDSPHIVKLYGTGRREGRIFIVLEWVEGATLYSLCNSLEAGLPYFAFFGVCESVLKALICAHGAIAEDGAPLNIVHRDICPQNILISKCGIVKLSDFGISKAKQRVTHTKTGEIKGRFEFMAPEQAGGDDIDGRADLYSLGRTLMAAGNLSGYPALVGAFVERLCASSPQSRFSSAKAALEALCEIKPRPSRQTAAGELAELISLLTLNSAVEIAPATPMLPKEAK